ncbi:hypothetical protein JZX86_26840 [Agrobacterium rosae]|uniref:hypothetical protein n=1 Tax=Agrobacterium rosae TaxID=1972867 RepID=UPI0019D3DB24|nr:hypothetical protein [Agrobacterium rosae]MBN7808945.1 hypothetical protein [Agrobacterium rosae]
MERHIRNQTIAEAHEAGESVEALASHFELTPTWVKRILREMEPYLRLRDTRPLPEGISLVSAVSIEQAIGIWPSNENLDELKNRKIDLLRSAAGRQIRIAFIEIENA